MHWDIFSKTVKTLKTVDRVWQQYRSMSIFSNITSIVGRDTWYNILSYYLIQLNLITTILESKINYIGMYYKLEN